MKCKTNQESVRLAPPDPPLSVNSDFFPLPFPRCPALTPAMPGGPLGRSPQDSRVSLASQFKSQGTFSEEAPALAQRQCSDPCSHSGILLCRKEALGEGSGAFLCNAKEMGGKGHTKIVLSIKNHSFTPL